MPRIPYNYSKDVTNPIKDLDINKRPPAHFLANAGAVPPFPVRIPAKEKLTGPPLNMKKYEYDINRVMEKLFKITVNNNE